MALLFEYCFYTGVVLALVGLLWSTWSLRHRNFRKLVLPIGILLLGLVLIVGPGIISRLMIVDLGPRETLVDGQRHVSLTGWDGESYDLLSAKSDVVVLQMANADVDDATLDFLAGMKQLQELDLNDSKITDEGLRKLSQLPALRTLRLRGTRITDQGFRDHLMNLPALKQIDLRKTAVSAESVSEWQDDDPSKRAFQ